MVGPISLRPDRDHDFNGATSDPSVVEEAWSTWRRESAAADEWLAGDVTLNSEVSRRDGSTSYVRDILVHMVEEYARHAGHADLLRECIDGTTGQSRLRTEGAGAYGLVRSDRLPGGACADILTRWTARRMQGT